MATPDGIKLGRKAQQRNARSAGRHPASDCANIAVAGAKIRLIEVFSLDLRTPEGLESAKKARKSTDRLQERFSALADALSEPEASEIREIAALISKDERGPRNTAIHGAWKAADGGYKVQHSERLEMKYIEGQKVDPETVSQSLVDEAVSHVDAIFRRLTKLEAELGAICSAAK